MENIVSYLCYTTLPNQNTRQGYNYKCFEYVHVYTKIFMDSPIWIGIGTYQAGSGLVSGLSSRVYISRILTFRDIRPIALLFFAFSYTIPGLFYHVYREGISRTNCFTGNARKIKPTKNYILKNGARDF
jgi:hypothetical protein